MIITKIISAAPRDVAGIPHVAINAQVEGGALVELVVPRSEAHNLAQIGLQLQHPDARHELLAHLIGILGDRIPDKGEDGHATKAFGLTDWTVGTTDDGSTVLSLALDQQKSCISFRLGEREARHLGKALERVIAPPTDVPYEKQMHPFIAVAEDIEWFRDEWVGRIYPPSRAELRRATGTLRQLLYYRAVADAWRHVGLAKRPQIVGPDLMALMESLGHDVQHIVAAFAAGFELHGLSVAFVTMRRVRNETTGVGPDAEEGFAVEVGNIARQVVPSAEAVGDPECAAVLHKWPSIEKYLAAPGAVRRGCFVSRRSVLEYFAHYSGGVHLDRAKNKPELQAAYALHEELEGRTDIVGLDGLYAEIFAMGYAIGSSPDMLHLAATIRTQAAEGDRSTPNGGVFSAGFGVSVA